MANIGHPQARNGKFVEDGMVTSGNDLIGIKRFLPPGASTYTAADVIANLLLGARATVVRENLTFALSSSSPTKLSS
jgi:hypothetical protein